MSSKITLTILKREIRKQLRQIKDEKNQREICSFLGFVENRNLSKEVETYFSATFPSGLTYYNWVLGNEKMKGLIEEVKGELT